VSAGCPSTRSTLGRRSSVAWRPAKRRSFGPWNENRRLKRLVADLSLDREMLKAVIAKNGLSS
jgi:hypothetical protein